MSVSVRKRQPGLAQVGAGLLRHRPPHRPRGQVEDALQLAFAQGLDRREEHGDGLADAGRGFEEQPSAAGQHAVGRHRELPLARPVVARKGKPSARMDSSRCWHQW